MSESTEAVNNVLGEENRALIAELTESLDIEAGLRDALRRAAPTRSTRGTL
ncbi:hypothetical protein [Nocardia bovistercoris]|uniref:Uncharacterized protein n=1 Tax=Nocardia bovistercoris TaxID=2785916 RepID=A0A931N7B7_9NOCA|nr:hypothetical protein [Nocardia bovistercoris]MBH0781431.1 hypothetical protein [Nocardia bovistercoris]